MNSLEASVKFDYKGEFFELSALIDIDHFINHEDFYNLVYLTIAKENNIGLYTYELEIMMDQEIIFSNEKGCSIGCVDNGLLDLDLLKRNYTRFICQPIVSDLIDKYALDKHNLKLTDALIDAYTLGKNN